MNHFRAAVLVSVVAALAASAQEPELQTEGVLKKGKSIVAALSLSGEGRVVVARVVNGVFGEAGKKNHFAEVELLDVESGRRHVLARRETPEGIPGIGANFTILGFTKGGKKLAVSTTGPGGDVTKRYLELPLSKDEKGKKDEEKKP